MSAHYTTDSSVAVVTLDNGAVNSMVCIGGGMGAAGVFEVL